MNNTAVEVHHVWKRFHRGEFHDSLRELIPALGKRLLGRAPKMSELRDGDFWALSDVDFTVARGEAVGVIGPNGAGKSTLLKILSNILRSNRGHVEVNGRLTGLLELGAGFHGDLTGRENIYINASILGMKKRDIDKKLDEIVAFSELEPFIDTPVKRYSTGMTTRLAFSVAAHMQVEILLVDEVLSVGDAAFRAKCIERMERLIRSDTSVLFVSHNLEQVRQLCDRCIVLDRGQLRFDGDVNRACEEYHNALESTAEGDVEENYSGPGRINAVRVYDAGGNSSHMVAQFLPFVIELEYELRESVSQVGVEITFEKPGVGRVSRCNNILDKFVLPKSQGSHRVALELDGLPYADGDYLLRTILTAGTSNDLTQHIRWLTVNGLTDNNQMVTLLKHQWRDTGIVEERFSCSHP